MTLFQFFVTYVTCWWLVLFMVLPHQADAPREPGRGHAPSAPSNPQLKKKFKWTTMLAIIPAVGLYLVVTEARADDMYHARSNTGCGTVNAKASEDVEARDGYSTDGKKVTPATIGGDSRIGNADHYDIPLALPSTGYLDRKPASAAVTPGSAAPAHNVDLSQSFINMGTMRIGRDGSSTIGGQPIAPQEDCAHAD